MSQDKPRKVLLDCGHESNRWVRIEGKTMCFSCYKVEQMKLNTRLGHK